MPDDDSTSEATDPTDRGRASATATSANDVSLFGVTATAFAPFGVMGTDAAIAGMTVAPVDSGGAPASGQTLSGSASLAPDSPGLVPAAVGSRLGEAADTLVTIPMATMGVPLAPDHDAGDSGSRSYGGSAPTPSADPMPSASPSQTEGSSDAPVKSSAEGSAAPIAADTSAITQAIGTIVDRADPIALGGQESALADVRASLDSLATALDGLAKGGGTLAPIPAVLPLPDIAAPALEDIVDPAVGAIVGLTGPGLSDAASSADMLVAPIMAPVAPVVDAIGTLPLSAPLAGADIDGGVQTLVGLLDGGTSYVVQDPAGGPTLFDGSSPIAALADADMPGLAPDMGGVLDDAVGTLLDGEALDPVGTPAGSLLGGLVTDHDDLLHG